MGLFYLLSAYVVRGRAHDTVFRGQKATEWAFLWGLIIQLRLLDLAAGAFTHWVISFSLFLK